MLLMPARVRATFGAGLAIGGYSASAMARGFISACGWRRVQSSIGWPISRHVLGLMPCHSWYYCDDNNAAQQ